MQVDSPDKFQRVSGSSLGGGTFWGLCRLLTGISSYPELAQLLEKGNNKYTFQCLSASAFLNNDTGSSFSLVVL
jgi:pantothenate kinase